MLSNILAMPRERRLAQEMAVNSLRLHGNEAELRLLADLAGAERFSSRRTILTLALRKLRKIQADPEMNAAILPVR